MLPKPTKFFNRISKKEFYVVLQKRVALTPCPLSRKARGRKI
jgi:hypothetical protein